MATQPLSAKSKQTNIRPHQLRASGFIPATVYGPHTPARSVQIDQKEFSKLVKILQPNQLIDLQLEEDKSVIKVLLHKVQKHPVKDNPLNIEFYAVDLKAEVSVNIPIRLTGEAPAVKLLKGILFQNMQNLHVRSLPTDIVPEIIVDISVLDNFEKGIFVEDLAIPGSVKTLADKRELVVKVLPQRTAEEETTGPAAATGETPAATPAAK
ncbi:MAG: 50S ribosomal protein L25 [bacterium]